MKTDEVVLVADRPQEHEAEIRVCGLRNVAAMRAPAADEPLFVGGHCTQGVPASFPWLYPYAAERAHSRQREVLRPVVSVSLPGPELATAPRVGLVDTGAETVLAADWLADLANAQGQPAPAALPVASGSGPFSMAHAETSKRLTSSARRR